MKVLNHGYRAIVWKGITPIGYLDELERYFFHGKTGSGRFPWVATLYFKRAKTGELYQADITTETEQEMITWIEDLIELRGK